MRRDAARAVLAAGLLSLTGLGCPFDPRDAPPPESSGGFCDGSAAPAQDPTALGARIARALSCFLIDSDYADSLDPDFTFIPDAETAGLAGTFFDNWDRTREISVMTQAIVGTEATRPVTVSMTVLSLIRNTLSPDPNRPRFDVQYTIRLVFADQTSVRYGGCADWELSGVLQPPVLLRTWTDLGRFETQGCTPVRPIDPGVGTSAFLRFDRGR